MGEPSRQSGAIVDGLQRTLEYRWWAASTYYPVLDDLDAAEFYVRRALERSREENLPYAAAEHDLKLIERLKAARG